jgi:transcriptional regulator with XRE-family HTH domain
VDNGELGRKLEEIRVARKLTQRSLASRTPGVTAQGISLIENGERYPTLVTLEALAKSLKCRFTIDPDGVRCQTL